MTGKKKAILFFTILCAVIILFTASFRFAALDEGFHKSEFRKYGVYSQFPKEDIEKINKDVLDYLTNKKSSIDNSFFNQKELSHLADVKKIFSSFFLFFYCSIFVFVFLFIVLAIYDKNTLGNISIVLIGGGIISIIASAILLLTVLFGFDSFFTGFHLVFFKPDTWVFGAGDKITTLYTWDFFYDITFRAIVTLLVIAKISVVSGFLMKKYLNNRQKIG